MDEINNERKYCVYMHVNKINNKIYIGQTGRSINDRWRKNGEGYLRKCNNGSYCQPLFANAINKYGWDNFEHIVFADCLTESEAYHIEKLLIAIYQSNNSEYRYNLSSGGESGATGIKMSDEQKKKISEARKNVGKMKIIGKIKSSLTNGRTVKIIRFMEKNIKKNRRCL